MRPLAAALALGFSAVLAAVALGLTGGGLGKTSALVALGLGVLAAVVAWRQTPPSPAPTGLASRIMLTVFGLVSLRAFLWLIYSSGDEIYILSPNNLGDLSLHLNFIRSLASGIPFWPESPILSETPLTYPLGADLWNSLLEICGIETERGLIWTGLAAAGLTAYALWRWGGAFTLAAFLFNGGLAGFVFLSNFQLDDYQSDLVWKNIFLSMFVTQRGLLFALPAGLLLLTTWREEFFHNAPAIIPRWLQILLYGGMPFFSMHTFIFLSALLPVIFLVQKSARRRLGILVGTAFLPATAAVLLVTGFFAASEGLHTEWGWILGDKGWGTFLKDFGLTLPLGLVTGVMVFKKRDREAAVFVGTAIGLFLLCCYVAFSRWEWDNLKLIMWSWLLLAPYLWQTVIRPLPLPARGALCLVLFFSGAISLLGGLDTRHGYQLARRSELAAWQAAVAHIPPEERFACVPDYNHPLILLGRRVVCGYEGHLWSHGLNYQSRMELLKGSLNGTIPWSDSALVLDASWAAVRQIDQPAMVPAGIGALYDLRPYLTPVPTTPAPPPPQPQPVGLPW